LLRDALMLSSLHTRMDSIVAAADAIPAILSFARRETDAALGSPRIKWINAAVVPESVVESAPMVRVHAWDTSRSGVFATEGTIIPNVKTLTIRGLLEDVFDAHAASVLRQHLPRTYLKIDAEGCDEGLVGDLLTGGLLPAVIHFEVQGREYAGREIVRLLREAGYRTPKQFGAHSLYSLVCPRRDLGMPAAAIAFGPDQVYWDDI
jgi:hypothetical protein